MPNPNKNSASRSVLSMHPKLRIWPFFGHFFSLDNWVLEHQNLLIFLVLMGVDILKYAPLPRSSQLSYLLFSRINLSPNFYQSWGGHGPRDPPSPWPYPDPKSTLAGSRKKNAQRALFECQRCQKIPAQSAGRENSTVLGWGWESSPRVRPYGQPWQVGGGGPDPSGPGGGTSPLLCPIPSWKESWPKTLNS